MVDVIDKSKIAERLKNLRFEKGATTAEVAKACDITPQAVTMYELGERIPRDEVKVKLARYYRKTVEFIFFS